MFEYILDQHGLGYGVDTNRRLFQAECRYRSIRCEHPMAQLSYHGHDLGARPAKTMLLHDQLMVSVAAHPETTSATDMARLRSYMKRLDIKHGVLANFGKTSLVLRAVIVD